MNKESERIRKKMITQLDSFIKNFESKTKHYSVTGEYVDNELLDHKGRCLIELYYDTLRLIVNSKWIAGISEERELQDLKGLREVISSWNSHGDRMYKRDAWYPDKDRVLLPLRSYKGRDIMYSTVVLPIKGWRRFLPKGCWTQ